jgi:hypothetical protein
MGLVPLAIQHFLYHLGESTQYFYNCNTASRDAAYLIIHSSSKKSALFRHKLHHGAYVINQIGSLHWQHECIGLHELADGEILVFGLPSQGAEVEPGGVVVRLASRQRLVSVDGRNLSAIGQRIVEAVKYELDICYKD